MPVHLQLNLNLVLLFLCGIIFPTFPRSIIYKLIVLSRSSCFLHTLSAAMQSSVCVFFPKNAARLLRGLFEIALHRGWPTMAYRLLGLCKMLDKRLWGFQNPLRQFTILKHETLVKLEGKNATVDRLRDMTSDEIGN